MDQGSTRKRSAVHNFAPTVTKFCVMWEGQALPHDTKFGNSRCEIVGRRVIFIWSLIHGSSWSGLIKVGPGVYWYQYFNSMMPSDAYIRQQTNHHCLLPGQCQAIIWISAGILLVGSLGINVSEILIEIHTFSFKKINLKLSSAKWWPFCLSLSVLWGNHNAWSIQVIFSEMWY